MLHANLKNEIKKNGFYIIFKMSPIGHHDKLDFHSKNCIEMFYANLDFHYIKVFYSNFPVNIAFYSLLRIFFLFIK